MEICHQIQVQEHMDYYPKLSYANQWRQPSKNVKGLKWFRECCLNTVELS